MSINYLVLDFETTGLDHTMEQVTEIGAIKLDAAFREIGMLHTYIQLHVPHGLSDFIKDLTGITEEQLAFGMLEQQGMSALGNLIDEDTIVVAQYAPFDFAFLANYGIHPKRFLCTKALTNIAEPYKKSNLGETCKRNGIMLEKAHTALGDVTATAELLQLRLSQGFGTYENIVTEQKGRPLAFVPLHTRTVLKPKDYLQ